MWRVEVRVFSFYIFTSYTVLSLYSFVYDVQAEQLSHSCYLQEEFMKDIKLMICSQITIYHPSLHQYAFSSKLFSKKKSQYIHSNGEQVVVTKLY